jgi:SAM-dependent methyltransferase
MAEERGESAEQPEPAGHRDLAGHPDQVRWDARYAGATPTFRPHPLAELALGPDLPGSPLPSSPDVPGSPVPGSPVPGSPVPGSPDVPGGPVPGSPDLPGGPVPSSPLLGGPLPAGSVADLACGPSGSALLAAVHGRQVTAVDVSAVALDLLGQEARRRGLAGRITLVHADLAGWCPDPAGYALVLCTGFWDPAVFAVAARAVAPGGVLGWEASTVAARETRPGLNPAWCLGPGEPATLLPAGFDVLSQQDQPDPDHGARRRLLARRRPQLII